MQTQNPFLDGLSRIATDAAGAAQGVRAEVEAFVKQRFEKLVADMNFVPRDEFEAVKALAAKALAETEALKSRLDALEAAARTQASKMQESASGEAG